MPRTSGVSERTEASDADAAVEPSQIEWVDVPPSPALKVDLRSVLSLPTLKDAGIHAGVGMLLESGKYRSTKKFTYEVLQSSTPVRVAVGHLIQMAGDREALVVSLVDYDNSGGDLKGREIAAMPLPLKTSARGQYKKEQHLMYVDAEKVLKVSAGPLDRVPGAHSSLIPRPILPPNNLLRLHV